MVSPFVPSPPSAAVNPVALEIERPVLPEPARQVTAAAGSAGARLSADAGPGGGRSDTSTPLEDVLDELNGNLQAWSTGIRFDVDPDAQRVVISIVDNATGEILRTVPSDAVIRIAKMIVQLQGRSVSTQA